MFVGEITELNGGVPIGRSHLIDERDAIGMFETFLTSGRESRNCSLSFARSLLLNSFKPQVR